MAEDLENEAGLREIPASEILEKIKNGEPIKYDHVKIVGNLDVRKLNLRMKKVTRTEYQISELHLPEECKVITSSITITNSKFEAPSVVASNTDFDNCLFKSQINFENSSFDYANFRGATFDGDANFKRVTFSEANFIGATFRGSADFEEAEFLFVDNKFGRLRIEGIGYWRVFHGLFTGATFDKLAIFSEATFHEDATFDRATFSEDASFYGAKFKLDTYFRQTIFKGFAGLSRAKFSGFVDFSESEFKGKIDLKDAVYPRIIVRWNNIKSNLIYQEPTFRLLIKNYRSLGLYADANDLYYEYRLKHREELQTHLMKFVDILEWIVIGYGIKPQRMIYTTVGIVTLFGIFFFAGGAICINPASCSNTSNNPLSPADSLLYSVIVFAAKIPTDLRAIGMFRWLSVVESFIGWLVLGIALNEIAKKNKMDEDIITLLK